MKKPKGYENDLGEYGVVFTDTYCGEPISWGFKILNHLGDERFNLLRTFGELDCSNGYVSVWYLILKKLNYKDAIKKYGKVTELRVGPRGGFRSITFGNKRFLSIKPTMEEKDKIKKELILVEQ